MFQLFKEKTIADIEALYQIRASWRSSRLCAPQRLSAWSSAGDTPSLYRSPGSGSQGFVGVPSEGQEPNSDESTRGSSMRCSSFSSASGSSSQSLDRKIQGRSTAQRRKVSTFPQLGGNEQLPEIQSMLVAPKMVASAFFSATGTLRSFTPSQTSYASKPAHWNPQASG